MPHANHTSHMPLNCDMGESYGQWRMGDDENIMPFIDWANIACGQHASDPETMQKTIALAQQHDVAIGAHPGYPDRIAFGRRPFPLDGDALQASLWHQLGALAGQCQTAGLQLNHVKPHGALYNKMMQDQDTMLCVLSAVAAYDKALPLLVQAQDQTRNAALQLLADEYSISLWFEAFADRAYLSNGQLAPRSHPNAVYDDPGTIVQQARLLVGKRQVATASGDMLDIAADTVCLHGDNPACVAALRQLRQQH
ncbi:MAG: 5-oxoprolinase subunit PxpA [Oceanococcus sp.]